jgi:ATP-dependent RNA helicase RhlE
MGFLPDVRRIVAHLPRTRRQTLLFSATLPRAIVELSRELMTEPLQVGVAGNTAPPRAITHALYPVPALLKPDLLAELLLSGEIGNAIVFCRTKHRADRVAQKLEKRGIAATRIHGNRSQAQRTSALEGFKRGRFRVLVATDIVARGIDVTALGHVVNLDVPAAPEDYIHRIGRTARAEASGEAFTLVAPEEEQDVRAIERALGFPLERRLVESFDYGVRAVRAAAAAAPTRPAASDFSGRNRRRGRGTLRASG